MPGLLQLTFILVRFSPLFFFLLILGLAACSSTPQSSSSMSPTQIEQTVQASVEQRLTEIAPTPDIEATVSFRLTAIAQDAQPTPTPLAPEIVNPPNPSPDAQAGFWERIVQIFNLILSYLPALINLALSLVNAVGLLGGPVAQLSCCGLPILVSGGVITITLKER